MEGFDEKCLKCFFNLLGWFEINMVIVMGFVDEVGIYSFRFWFFYDEVVKVW